MKITEPGIFYDVPSADYFADPCPSPSLTQSIAKILIERSPLHAWHAHPRLNPDFRESDDTKYDIGNIAHKLLIGRGKELEIFDAPDWNATGMGKGAKTALHEKRDAARTAGKVAVLRKSVTRAERMVKAAIEQLDLRKLGTLFRVGNGEAVTAWREDHIWLRQMIDWLSPGLNDFADYKTTDMSAAPHGMDRMMINAGWPIQAAMAERGLDAIDPDGAGRRKFFFVVQEAEPPYALTVVDLSEGPLTMGRKQLDYAVNVWRQCVASDRWPGYPLDIARPQYPGWAETRWLDRELAEDERRTRVKMLTDMAGG